MHQAVTSGSFNLWSYQDEIKMKYINRQTAKIKQYTLMWFQLWKIDRSHLQSHQFECIFLNRVRGILADSRWKRKCCFEYLWDTWMWQSFSQLNHENVIYLFQGPIVPKYIILMMLPTWIVQCFFLICSSVQLKGLLRLLWMNFQNCYVPEEKYLSQLCALFLISLVYPT